MARGPAITEIEREKIFALHKERISFRSIAEILHRSVGPVQGIVRQGFKDEHLKHWKGNQNISETQKRTAIRMGLKGEDSARAIQAELNLPISHRCFQ